MSFSPRAVIALVSVIHFAIPFAFIAGGAARTNAFLTNDDTYYYLQTAWNARHVGFVTFDAINPTNGVQFLWFSILYGLSFLTNDKSVLLGLASTMAVVLACLPYAVIWRLSSDTWTSPRSLLTVVMAALWLVICLYRPNQYLVALESSSPRLRDLDDRAPIRADLPAGEGRVGEFRVRALLRSAPGAEHLDAAGQLRPVGVLPCPPALHDGEAGAESAFMLSVPRSSRWAQSACSGSSSWPAAVCCP